MPCRAMRWVVGWALPSCDPWLTQCFVREAFASVWLGLDFQGPFCGRIWALVARPVRPGRGRGQLALVHTENGVP